MALGLGDRPTRKPGARTAMAAQKRYVKGLIPNAARCEPKSMFRAGVQQTHIYPARLAADHTRPFTRVPPEPHRQLRATPCPPTTRRPTTAANSPPLTPTSISPLSTSSLSSSLSSSRPRLPQATTALRARLRRADPRQFPAVSTDRLSYGVTRILIQSCR